MNKTVLTLCTLLCGSVVSKAEIKILVQPMTNVEKCREIITESFRTVCIKGNECIVQGKNLARNLILTGRTQAINGIDSAKNYTQDLGIQAKRHATVGFEILNNYISKNGTKIAVAGAAIALGVVAFKLFQKMSKKAPVACSVNYV